MYVSTDEQQSGLLIAVISGGRSALSQRPTFRLLDAMGSFAADVVWVVSEKDASGYEPDGRHMAVYPTGWARQYAATHWMQPQAPDPAGFLGAFPGREWACLEAERRGCWGVLQLDDNITDLHMPRAGLVGKQIVDRNGGLALFADLLAAVALSTNGRMVGAQLGGIGIARPVIARAGFPYSIFVERVGVGREHWYGPFEDDITHAFQYGIRADGATASVIPSLRYGKESKSKSGMRGAYNEHRSQQLARIFPESAKVGIRRSKSNGYGGPRIFHTMARDAIRNPLVVHDRELFGRAKARIESLMIEWHEAHRIANVAKVAKRAAAAM